MTRVRQSARARADLVRIWRWIAQRDEERASAIIRRIEARAAILARHPEAGRLRPDIAPDARSLSVERWLIFYRIDRNGAEVVRVVDASRDLTKMEWPRTTIHSRAGSPHSSIRTPVLRTSANHRRTSAA